MGDLDNKERCLYICFSLGNNYNLLNFIIEKSLSASYPYISHKLQMVHKAPFSSHLFNIFQPLPPPTTPTNRGTNTLNHPKTKLLYTTIATHCPFTNSAIPSTLKPPSEKKTNQTNNYGALHMYYPCWTLNLTTVHSWKTGIISEVDTPKKQDHVWSRPLTMLLLQLKTAGLLSLKIEWANSFSVQKLCYMWGRHTQRLYCKAGIK